MYGWRAYRAPSMDPASEIQLLLIGLSDYGRLCRARAAEIGALAGEGVEAESQLVRALPG